MEPKLTKIPLTNVPNWYRGTQKRYPGGGYLNYRAVSGSKTYRLLCVSMVSFDLKSIIVIGDPIFDA